MAKYIPKEFAPVVFPAWHNIFNTLSPEERSELLLAISGYPDYEPRNVALWPFFKGELDRQRDKFASRNQRLRENRATGVDKSQQKSTGVDRSESEKHVVDKDAEHRTITITRTRTETRTGTETETEKDIDTHPSPSARTASVSANRVPAIQKPDGIESADWQAYIKLRKQKRLPLTQRALNAMLTEADKVNLTPQQMIVCCLERSWASFRADWYEKEQSEKPLDIDEYIRKNAASFDDYVPPESGEHL